MLRRHAGCALLFAIAHGGCTTPPPEPTDADVAMELATRNDPAHVERALAMLDLAPLALPRPRIGTPPDPRTAETWRAFALANDPDVRRARLDVAFAEASARAAGRPAAIGVTATTMDAGDLRRESELTLSFDLLGVLGLGRAAAASALADARLRASVLRHEAAAWRAWYRVERARVTVAAAALRLDEIATVAALVDGDRIRIDVLSRRGWLASDHLLEATAMLHRVDERRALAAAELAAARSALAITAGLAPDDPLLNGVDANALDDALGAAPYADALPTLAELLARHPELRALRVELAVTTAAFEAVAARRWPDLRIGPMWTWMPGETMTGGMIDAMFDFPGAVGAELDALRAEHAVKRAGLTDAAARIRADLATTVARTAAAETVLRDHATPQYDDGVARFRAARARFATDHATLDRWSMALRERLGAVDALVDARWNAAVARTELAETAGPRR